MVMRFNERAKEMNNKILTGILTIAVCASTILSSAEERKCDDIAKDIIKTGKMPPSFQLRKLMGEVLSPDDENKPTDTSAMYALAEIFLHIAKNEVTTKKEAMERIRGGDVKNENAKTDGMGAYNMAIAIVLYYPDSPYSLAAFELAEEAVKFAEKEYSEKLPSLTSLGYPEKLGDTSKKLSRKKN